MDYPGAGRIALLRQEHASHCRGWCPQECIVLVLFRVIGTTEISEAVDGIIPELCWLNVAPKHGYKIRQRVSDRLQSPLNSVQGSSVLLS